MMEMPPVVSRYDFKKKKKKTDLRISRYWENHGLDREEKKTDPIAKKLSTVVQRVDRGGGSWWRAASR
jgi:hypothetical protein